MIRASTLIWLLILSFSAFSLFQVKYRVQDLRKDLAEINRQLEEERDAIHVLKAEWSYLNQPDRLRTIVDRHLQLTPMMVTQITPSFDQAVSYAALDGKAVKTKAPVVEQLAQAAPGKEPEDAEASKVMMLKVPPAVKIPIKTAKANVLRLPAKTTQVAALKESPEHVLKLPARQRHSYPSMEPILTSLHTER
jgi:hypothetical protein